MAKNTEQTIINMGREYNDLNDAVPTAGEIKFSGMFKKLFQDPAYADALFAVKIRPHFVSYSGEPALYNGKTIFELELEAESILNNPPFDDWYENIYLPMLQNAPFPTDALEKEKSIFGKETEMYLEYWRETASAEDKLAYENAVKEVQNAKVTAKEGALAMLERERDRLAEHGFDVVIDGIGSSDFDSLDYYIYGLITGQQLKGFPVDPDYGYEIVWDTRDTAPQDTRGTAYTQDNNICVINEKEP
jgi:hypothetical protein